jgi:RNA polymerase sigma factor (sigma-70 family)
MLDDAELLRRYADSRSEGAFAELVERNIGLVYHSALRRTNGDTHLAEDIAQQVFASLAKEARTVAMHPAPAGWLYVATRNAAANLMRAERRRKARELESAALQDRSTDAGALTDWEQLRLQLDALLDKLDEQDRDAVLLRCLQERPFVEVGRMLRTSEDAARKRVDRALEKLRTLLASRGITSTSAALAFALGSQAALAAPLGLAARVSGVALTPTPTVALMTASKISLTVAVAIALAAGGSQYVRHLREAHLKQEVEALRVAVAGNAASVSQAYKAASDSSAAVGAGNARGRPGAQFKTGAAARASWPALTGGMINSAKWSNRGTATPLAALESYLWAVDHVDVGVTGDTIGFGVLRPKVEAFYASLPDDVRAQYDTPEKLWALVMTGAPHAPAIVSYGVVAQGPDPSQPNSSVTVNLVVERSDGATIEGDVNLELTASGWRYTLGDNLILPMLEHGKQYLGIK